MTPVQYAMLQALATQPGIDPRMPARRVGLDGSTIAGVVDRLEARGLVQRSSSPDGRRVRLLRLTDEGRTLLAQVVPAMRRAQQRILAPLPAGERRTFMRMLREPVNANNELSRVPREPG